MKYHAKRIPHWHLWHRSFDSKLDQEAVDFWGLPSKRNRCADTSRICLALSSQERLQTLFAELFNLPISAGTLAKINSTFSEKITGVLKNLQEHLIKTQVKHMDETGFRIRGQTQWLDVLYAL